MPLKIIDQRTLLGGLGAAVAAGGAYWLGRTDVGISDGKSRARPVAGDLALPPAVDVVVIGGGIVGAATALTLAERGISVALCEKGVIAGEASSRAMGYIDSQFADPARFPLLARNFELWREANARTGLETGYRKKGLILPLEGEEAAEGARGWTASLNGVEGLSGEVLTRNQLLKLVPDMVDPPEAALHTPFDGMVEPRLAAPAIAQAAQDKGAKILQHCAVRGIETSGGKISGVITEKGRIACQAAVIAGGYWTPPLVRSLGIDYDQFDVFLSMVELSAPGNGPAIPFSAEAYGFRPQIDGRYTFGVVDFAAPIMPSTIRNLRRLKPAIGAFWPMAHPGLSPALFWDALTQRRTWALDKPSPFEKIRILTPNFRPKPLQEGRKILNRHFPAFDTATITDQWAGAISTTLDNMPVISAIPGHDGLFIGSGFSYGLTYGLGAGEALADLATGRTPQVDLTPYRLGRFTDGTAIHYHA